MATTREIPSVWTVLALITACIVACPAQAKYSGGSGTAKDPWRIANKKDLLALAADTKDYGAHFVLTADISLAKEPFTLAVIAPSLHPGAHREFLDTPFTGTFDGNGHKITDLKINASMSLGYLGLFGCVAREGVVKNLRMERVSIADRLVTAAYVGLLVGFNNGGTITDCSVAGDITAAGGFVPEAAGALAGVNDAGGTIRRCHTVAGTVHGQECIGSLVGINYSGGRITECDAAGKVVAQNGFAGGLVGWNWGRIDRCEAMGDTTASGIAPVGGLAGGNDGIIIHCLSTGHVTMSGISDVGGLAGSNRGTIIDCQATGDVDGDRAHDRAGLVGWNKGLIANCRATGDISRGESISSSGGAVGTNRRVIASCCATGNVDGGYGMPVGGFAGSNDPNASILNCYASANVAGMFTIGGLVGSNAGAITNCHAVGRVGGGGDPRYPAGGLTARSDVGRQAVGSFWDVQTTGQSKSAGGTGKTTAEMKTAKTFLDAAWDFTCIWNIVEKQSYPFLQFNPEADLNADQKVSLKDFARLAANWSKSCGVSTDPKHPLPACFLAGDLNYDKKVDARDLWLMGVQWLDSRAQNVVQ